MFAEKSSHQDLTFEFIYESADVIVGEDSVAVFNGSIVNISSSIINLAVVRRVDVNLEGWASSICIGSLCYSDWVDSVSVNIESGDTASIGVLVWTNGSGDNSLQLDFFNSLIPGDNILFNLNIFTNPVLGIKNQVLNPDTYITVNAYPNPFNPFIIFDYNLKENIDVSFSIYDLRGRLIKTLTSGNFLIGNSSIIWDATDNAGKNMPGGIYFCKIQAGNIIKYRKIIFNK